MSCEICCDGNCDDIIMINGDTLYQWDIDRTIIIFNNPDIQQAHFSHDPKCGQALVVETHTDDDKLLAYIPNSLLTSPRDIYVWTWKDEHTLSGACKLQVHARPRPDNYIYKPTDVITLESVMQWVKDTLDEYVIENASNYEYLTNKPSIEGVELVGDKKMEEFGVVPLSFAKIDAIFEEGDLDG